MSLYIFIHLWSINSYAALLETPTGKVWGGGGGGGQGCVIPLMPQPQLEEGEGTPRGRVWGREREHLREGFGGGRGNTSEGFGGGVVTSLMCEPPQIGGRRSHYLHINKRGKGQTYGFLYALAIKEGEDELKLFLCQ